MKVVEWVVEERGGAARRRAEGELREEEYGGEDAKVDEVMPYSDSVDASDTGRDPGDSCSPHKGCA